MYSKLVRTLQPNNKKVDKMKGILIANVSANGKVLLAENSNHQAPQEAIGFFMQKAIQTGNLVLGRKTFEQILQHPAAKQAFSDVEIVLLSTTNKKVEEYQVVGTPEQAIKYLEEKGFSEITVGGGTQTYNAFLQKDLITEIYFNIIPVITGNGGVIGTNEDLFAKFKLSEHKLLTDDIVQLHLSKI